MKVKLILVCAVSALFGSQVIQAAPLCTTASMATYIAQGACNIGNITFSFGSNAYIFAPDDVNVSAAQVTVTPVGTGLTPNAATGFTFSANNSGWTATNPDTRLTNAADVNITFDASIALAQTTLTSTTVTIDPTLVNFAGNTGLLVGEGIMDVKTSNTVGFINLAIVGNTGAQSIAGGGSALTGTALFSSSDVNINKDVDILALDGPIPQASASLTALTETLTYGTVPEPGALRACRGWPGVALLRRFLMAIVGRFVVSSR